MSSKKYQVVQNCYTGGRWYKRGEIVEFDSKVSVNNKLFKTSDGSKPVLFDPTSNVAQKNITAARMAGIVGKTQSQSKNVVQTIKSPTTE